jgi:hypothetical protein
MGEFMSTLTRTDLPFRSKSSRVRNSSPMTDA